MLRKENRIALIITLIPLLVWGLMSLPVNAQSITSVSCANIPIDVGHVRWGNNTINFSGTFFSPENDISVQEIRLPMFRQAGGAANNASRWTLYEVNGVPSGLGANQPTFSSTAAAIPLWTSGSIAKADLPTYSLFTDVTRGDPDNWHAETVSPAVELEAGKFYAVGAWAFVNGTTSFSEQVAYGQNSTGDCGIENVYITASGEVYTNADDIIAANINGGGAGCFFSAFAFPCNTVSGINASAGFAIYGVEVFPVDDSGIDSWYPNFLESIGMNTPFGSFLVGILIALSMAGIMMALKIPWIFSLGVPAILSVALTLANSISTDLFLSGVAIALGAGILAIIGLLIRGGSKDGG